MTLYTGKIRDRLLGGLRTRNIEYERDAGSRREKKAEKKRRGKDSSRIAEKLLLLEYREFAGREGGRKRRGGFVCSREATRMFRESG